MSLSPEVCQNPHSLSSFTSLKLGIGGAAGYVFPGRLAEANKDLSILLIESGPNNFGDPMVTVPAFWLSHTDPSDKYTWSYKASASHYLAGRESIVPAGRIVRISKNHTRPVIRAPLNSHPRTEGSLEFEDIHVPCMC